MGRGSANCPNAAGSRAGAWLHCWGEGRWKSGPQQRLAMQEVEPERFGGHPESFHPGHSGQWGGQETGKARHLLVTVILVNRGRGSGTGNEEPRPDSHCRS